MVTAKAFFFDRDGIINKSLVVDGRPFPPRSMEEFAFTEGIEDLIKSLHKSGFKIIIVTNQPDIKKGHEYFALMESFHHLIRKNLIIDDLYFCPHDDADKCPCRKPLPGMIHQAMKKHRLAPEQCFLVGDRWRDVGAGKNSGIKTYFVDYSYDESVSHLEKYPPDYRISSIVELGQLLKSQRIIS